MSSRFRSIVRRISSAGVSLFLLVLPVLLVPGCASEVRAKRFTELLQRYPETDAPLSMRQLTESTVLPIAGKDRAITVIVHPAYSLFFRDERKSIYTAAKYDLLEYQLAAEARFIIKMAKSGDPLILVLPGNYPKDSIAPRSYTMYLNSTTGGSPAVFYILSETSHSGSIPLETTVLLHDLLRKSRVKTLLIGGGYIGRCQKEFYSQLTTYVEDVSAFIVPEISSISPDDISTGEAEDILMSLHQKDFQPVAEFVDMKHRGSAEVRSLTSLSR
ncbi:MAG: hypothetical protein OEW15_12965 [Nitrospirota bacterium]|nr:hypothetical protein [Nitrospirota bacterium]